MKRVQNLLRILNGCANSDPGAKITLTPDFEVPHEVFILFFEFIAYMFILYMYMYVAFWCVKMQI
jgi:hypothetical protein